MLWRTADVLAPADRVWDLLVDLDRWPTWGPTVRDATLDGGGRRLHAGATGRVVPLVGPSLPYRVTDWTEGRSWSWRVAGLPATRHRVEEVGPNRCRVALGTPFWAAAYLPVLEVAARRLARLATP